MKEFENEKKPDEIFENEEVSGANDIVDADSLEETETETTETVGVVEEISAEDAIPQKNPVKEIVSWVLCIAIAIAVALFLRSHVFTMVKVDGQSMEPTLKHGDRLFTRIIGYTPSRGDVVIFHPAHNPQTAYVKRVIATEGDRIWIDEKTGDVHLLEKGSDKWIILDEPYINEYVPGEYIVGAGIAQRYADNDGDGLPDSDGNGLLIRKDHIFVMGDNRNHSQDSRSGNVGQVHVDSIIGKASLRWWPLSELGSIYPENSKETKTIRIVGYTLLGIFVLLIGLWIWKKYFRKTGNQ